MKLKAQAGGHVTQIHVSEGDVVAEGDMLAVSELMKMLSEVRAPGPGKIAKIWFSVGEMIEEGQPLFDFEPDEGRKSATSTVVQSSNADALLSELDSRRKALSDEGRGERIARRHANGGRSARENLTDLLDEGSVNELGMHALAAQHSTHTMEKLIDRSAGDGVITATGTVEGIPVAVLIVDYTVMAGTQGHFHHRKVDRLLELAHKRDLPLILYPEGGGGRPNDLDAHAISVAQLELMTFHRIAGLRGKVPVLAIVHGYCFAGSAAFAAVADVIIATEAACIGMGGPAMIEGGGLGSFSPDEVGPVAIHAQTGVVDIVCKDEAEATARAKTTLKLLTNTYEPDGGISDVEMNDLMPKDRRTVFDVHAVVDGLVDKGSFLELKREHSPNMIIGLARLSGRVVGVLANQNEHLGGAIDGPAAQKASHLLDLCQSHSLPVISLIDTPGFMVGPEAEETGQVAPIGRFFTSGARFEQPILAVVLRRAYGLGAMAMAGGSLHSSDVTLSWPCGEFGAMGLEGAVRLGMRDQLAAIEDEEERRMEFDRLVEDFYERGKALNAAAFFELDDVIKPSETRLRLIAALNI